LCIYDLTQNINIPERVIVKKRIQECQINENIIMGSSRSLILGKSLNMIGFSNISVSGAVIQDYENLIDLVTFDGEKIYLEISPWLFNSQNIDERYLEFENKLNLSKLKRYLNLDYLFENLTYPKFNVLDYKSQDKFIRYVDGSIKYSLNNINKKREKMRNSSLEEKLRNSMIRLDNFEKVTNNRKKRIVKFFEKIEKKFKKIYLIKYPYMPLVYNDLIEKRPVLKDISNLIDSIAKQKNFRIIGSFNPKKFKINNEDFLDEIHLNENGLKKLFENY